MALPLGIDRRASAGRPDATPAATLDGVSVDIKRTPVLKDVSLGLDAGEVTVLLGPNGAGKTTLIRTLCGGLAPTRGSVRVEGRDPRRSRAARGRIGLVPQDVALYGRLTVAENLRCFAFLAGYRPVAAARQAATALHLTQLAPSADRLVSALSGGLQRRANIACALVAEPGLLLLDEPTVGLDVDARRAVHAVLRRLADEACVAILLTTHDFDEAAVLADKVIVLDRGTVLASGTPADLLHRVHGHDARVVELVLPEVADTATEALLRRDGYEPGPGRISWGKRVLAGDGPAFLDALAVRGVAVAELRVRRPSLETLYLDLLRARARP